MPRWRPGRNPWPTKLATLDGHSPLASAGSAATLVLIIDDAMLRDATGYGPEPNYPTGDHRSALHLPDQFVVLTAAAYFFVPSMTVLRTVLT